MNPFRRFFLLVLLTAASFHPLFAQWVQTNGPSGGYVRSLAVSGTNLFAGTWGGGVFRFTNNGTSWTQVNNGLTTTNVQSLAVSGTNFFAGTEGGGVFRSTNNGTSWTRFNTGLKNTNVFSFAVNDKYLFAGTRLGGVWRRPFFRDYNCCATILRWITCGVPSRAKLPKSIQSRYNHKMVNATR